MAQKSSPSRDHGSRRQERTGARAQAESIDVIRAVLAEADRARAQRERKTVATDSSASQQAKARSANAILKDLAAKEADHLLAEEDGSP